MDPKDTKRPAENSSASKRRSVRSRKRNNSGNAAKSNPAEVTEAEATASSSTEVTAVGSVAAPAAPSPIPKTKPKAMPKEAETKVDTPKSKVTEEVVATNTKDVTNTKSNKTAEPAEQKKQGGGAAMVVALLALIVAIIALLGGGWLWQQGQLERESSAALNRDVANLKGQSNQQDARLQGSVKQLQQMQQQSSEKLGNAVANVAASEQRMQKFESSFRDALPTDWLLAEASYLVQMAERKLTLEQDRATALALLKDADSRIALMGKPALNPVRQALQRDIAKVEALPRIDIDGIAMAMEVLVQDIDTLPLNRVELPELNQAEPNNELSSDVNEWESNLVNSWHALLEDFITIRRRQDQVQPLLAPAQEWYLREHLRGKLLQAQLALYHGNEKALDQALVTAQGWVRDYFNLESTQVESALNRMASWQGTSLAQIEAVELSSLAALNKAADDLLRQEAP